ncbi:MAG: glycosyltransferase family 2 protein [Acidimicrobiales bacterium]
MAKQRSTPEHTTPHPTEGPPRRSPTPDDGAPSGLAPAPPLLASPARLAAARSRRRQWGTERHPRTLPVMAPPATRPMVSGARFALFLTVVAWATYVTEQVLRLTNRPLEARDLAESVAYLGIVTLLTASASAYLLCRLGQLTRSRTHRRVARSLLDDAFEHDRPSMTVLIPSYREEPRVLRQTLLSAALQEYPDLRIVLLIDDPHQPSDAEHQRLLEAARDVPREIALLLEGPRQLFRQAQEDFDARPAAGALQPAELLELATNFHTAAEWFRQEMDTIGSTAADHTDEFLVNDVLERYRDDLQRTASALEEAAALPEVVVSRTRAAQLYRRLVWIFEAHLSSFERKAFACLSHEANKAMNLNSYIGLMGGPSNGRYRVQAAPGGNVLLEAGEHDEALEIPDSDFVLTLDADSMLLPEYCLRLVHFLSQPENGDVAVVQTPYSSYRGAATRIERLAGATTDLQHLVHQGLTAHGATFWVGANAVLRKRSLDELVQLEQERGFVVRRYVQDRTVIEDTESSIDLRARGWRLHNYPERLSYSATPPDFGSLCIQRQRWANGGLVIAPKLLALVRFGRARKAVNPQLRLSPAELFLRMTYLTSITWATVGLLVLLCYPFEERLLSRWALLTALPYFVAMANDLRRCGYRRSDVLRLYGFNLLLLPINLAGTAQSLVQAIGGQKIAFARTPKIGTRTVAPLWFLLLPVALIAWSAYTLARDVHEQAYLHAIFAGSNGLLTLYAVLSLVGLRNLVADVALNLRERMYRPAREEQCPTSTPNWVTVLYHGAAETAQQHDAAPMAVALAAGDHVRALGGGTDPRQPMVRIHPERRAAPEPTAEGSTIVISADPAAATTLAPKDFSTTLASCVAQLSQSGQVTLREHQGGVAIEVIPTVVRHGHRRRRTDVHTRTHLVDLTTAPQSASANQPCAQESRP